MVVCWWSGGIRRGRPKTKNKYIAQVEWNNKPIHHKQNMDNNRHTNNIMKAKYTKLKNKDVSRVHTSSMRASTSPSECLAKM